ncbi:MAG: hypothetical protein JW818_03745 [Pirellulales bacterium]|nr:hypothetical protein [Pirellulales bacterium]
MNHPAANAAASHKIEQFTVARSLRLHVPDKRGEVIQREIDRLQRDLVDLRGQWEWLQGDLKARKEAFERATTILNQEGRFRQKAEALRTVIGRIVCHFSKSGKRCTLKSIDIFAAEDGAIQPFLFPE